MNEDFNRAAFGPSSRHRIEQNNKRRPKPVMAYNLTPKGPIKKAIMSRSANEKNIAIDRENAFMEKRLARRRGQAKEAFNDRSKKGFGIE